MTDGDVTVSLVQRAKSGDADAREALVRGHLRAAYATALAVLERPSDAEDVIQDAFVTALKQLDTCRNPEKFRPWLLTIVRNMARTARSRRRLRDVSAHDDAEWPDEPIEMPDAAARKHLISGLRRLTETQREVVLLHDMNGWTHAEIGVALDISETSSRQYLFVARKALREYLASCIPGEEL